MIGADRQGIDEEALITFTEECQSLLVRGQRKLKSCGKDQAPARSSILFQQAWKQFSEAHQSSPSRVNNNITRRRRSHGNDNDASGDEHCSTSHKKGRSETHAGAHKTSAIEFKFLLNVFSLVLYILEVFSIILLALFAFYTVIVLHKPTQAFVSRNTQNLIYPIMRGLRILALPFVRAFPVLTGCSCFK